MIAKCVVGADFRCNSRLHTILSDSHPVLHHLLLAIKSQQYKLRPRTQFHIYAQIVLSQ